MSLWGMVQSLFGNSTGKAKKMIEEVNAKALADMLKSGQAIVIDVRESDEYKAGHIEGAESIPLSVFSQKFDKAKYPAGKKIVLQCQGGVRSMKACNIAHDLAEQEHVSNLTGGLNAWLAAGLPVSR